MARKKKKQNTNVESKNSIVYSGNVSISYKRNEPGKPRVSLKRHNAGCDDLFTFIAKALGGYTDPDLRPAAIMLYGNDIPFLVYPVAYLSTPEVSKNKVTYVFTIPGRALVIQPNPQTPINKLKLLSNKNNICAIIELTGEDIISSVDPTESLLIRWELVFENKQQA